VVDATTEEAVPQEAFVDTLPGFGQTQEGVEGQGERQGGRRRNRRGGRGGRDRDEAGGDNSLSATPANEPTGDAVPADASLPVESTEQPIDATPRGDGTEAGDGRRRGRGRDRNRRERSPEGAVAEGVTSDAAMPAETAASEAVSQPASIEPQAFIEASAPQVAPIEVEAEVATASAAAEPVAAAPAPVVMTPAPVATALAPVSAAAAVAAPVAPAPVAAPPAPFVLPTDSLQAVAEAAGLQWVNSDAEKIRAVQAAMAAAPAPVHVPRERKPVEVVDAGPLVLVETRKDLSQFKLPFETAQQSPPQP
jgi:ribonuclease E